MCELWLEAIDPNSNVTLDKDACPKVWASFDTGWNQRGNSHNSPSSHGFFIGKHTRDVVQDCVLSKLCSIDSAWEEKMKKAGTPNVPVPEHCCTKNHTGSSGSMAPAAAVNMTTKLHDVCCVNIELICMDDDAPTRLALHWSNADHKKNHNTGVLPQVPVTRGPNEGKDHDCPDEGMSPSHIPQPDSCADPNH